MAGSQSSGTPRQVILFSGHMIDGPNRETRRFPPDKERNVADAIAAVIRELNTGNQDLAICSGACGGDLLFAEACLARDARLEIHLPFEEEIFLKESVSFAGANWTSRYFAAKNHPNTTLHVLPQEPDIFAESTNPYERVNQWMLSTALIHGPEKLRLVVLWDGKSPDGPGGTKHMIQEALSKGNLDASPKSTQTIPIDSGETLSLYLYQR